MTEDETPPRSCARAFGLVSDDASCEQSRRDRPRRKHLEMDHREKFLFVRRMRPDRSSDSGEVGPDRRRGSYPMADRAAGIERRVRRGRWSAPEAQIGHRHPLQGAERLQSVTQEAGSVVAGWQWFGCCSRQRFLQNSSSLFIKKPALRMARFFLARSGKYGGFGFRSWEKFVLAIKEFQQRVALFFS